ncbi:uncharacterized protein N7496_011755 [Penicillium cataractarum]|uniref:Uncharacterized protein n=1 Tax=Penicillium cataractarum TaxID=2100454 RepID=A0A9W9RG12_9EURO|nr:uncharacterized protein N7496_011755 [Penicillium cataractarum]KAJ5359342.1 hypothetical protein N7496_011755 [Penicillium cataractarum]
MASDSLLECFHTIGESIHLHESPARSLPDPASPSLVILCTWVGGATPRRINKYLAQYQEIFPTSSLLLITTNVPDTAFRPLTWIRANLKPARNAINRIVGREIGQNTVESSSRQRGILLHLFSHGGGNIASQLALSMKAEPDRGALFFSNLRTIILDCCPGDDTFERMYAATRVSVPQTPVAQFLGKTVMYPALAVVNGFQQAGLVRAVKDLRDILNAPSTFGSTPRRLYIYSKEDIVIGWEDVQSHLEDAQNRGYSVGQVCFEQGPHCGLVMEDPNRYWDAVKNFWAGEDVWDVSPNGSQGTSTGKRAIIPSKL